MLSGLWRLVIFYDKENKHDFAKPVPRNLQNLGVLCKTSLSSLDKCNQF